ncbi:MAG TPA: LON peptidase substrate-binding domain-containing protein [Acidimicrobiales bacterium]
MVVTPMFPLGTVLVPGMPLPLHVFEPRYRAMLRDCLAGDRTFGVVLIERGSEVGGGDVRTDVGTRARIVEAEELPDGRWAVVALGVERIRVDRWLPDDPYPRAEVTAWPDDPATGPAEDPRPAITAQLRRAGALVRELGHPGAPLDLELDGDPVVDSYQAMLAAPLGPADRHQLLAAATLAERWSLLRDRLTEQIELLEARLSFGG